MIAASATERTAPWRGPWVIAVLVVLCMLLGAFFRLHHLGLRAMRPDELNGWLMVNRASSASDLYWNIEKYAGGGVMPFSIALSRAFMDTFGLPRTFFWHRFLFALSGIACIPLMYICGRRLGGKWTGVAAALLLAVNPFHIQCSRESYRYVYTTFGTLLALYTVMKLFDFLQNGKKPGIRSWVSLLFGTYLLTNATSTSWPFAFLFCGAVAVLALFPAIRSPRSFRAILPTWGMIALGALPATFTAWGFPVLLGRDIQEAQSRIRNQVAFFDPAGFEFFARAGWGDTPVRLVFLAMAGFLIALWLWRGRRQVMRSGMFGLLILGFLLGMVGRYVMNAHFHPRYIVPLVPVYMLIAGAAFVDIGRISRFAAGRIHGKWLSVMVILISCALTVPAAWLVTRMQGSPVPYKEMSRWADANLPPGTLVLCDRYFSAYNEMAANSAERIQFVATVPNETEELYERLEWRKTAETFFRNDPGSAFMEQKHKWTEFGPWLWPEDYFAREQAFYDPVFWELVEKGLHYRTVSLSLPRDAYIYKIRYNTPEDLILRARRNGTSAFLLYAGGWQYTKTRDYRDWRVMGPAAVVRACNVTRAPLDAVLSIQAAVPSGNKTLRVENGNVEFQAGRIEVRNLPVSLSPGWNDIELQDPNWRAAQVPLLVERIQVVPRSSAKAGMVE